MVKKTYSFTTSGDTGQKSQPDVQDGGFEDNNETSKDVIRNENAFNGSIHRGNDKKHKNIIIASNGNTEDKQNKDVIKNGNLSLSVVDETDLDQVAFSKSASNGEKDSKDNPNDVPLWQLFRFSDKRDKLLLVIGTLASVVAGIAFPLNILVYGQLATAFIYYTVLLNSDSTGGNSTADLPFNTDDYDDIYATARQHALYFCLIGVGVIVFTFIQYLCWDIAQERQMRTIREKFFKSVIHHDISWFDTHRGGELGSTFSESMHAISASIGKDLAICIQWTVTCIGAYCIAMYRGWKVALACMAFSPLLILSGFLLTKWVKTVAMKESMAYAQAGCVVEEVLSSIKTVIAFNGQDKEAQRYENKLKKGSSSSFSKGFAVGVGMGAIWLVMYLIFCTAFGYGIKLMSEREPGFEPGNVLTIFIGVMIGSMSLGQAFPFLETFGNGKAAAAKIFQTIDQTPLIDSSSDKEEKPENITGRLELRNVSFKYPARPEVQVLEF